MMENYYTPEQLRALHHKRAQVTLSPKYISIVSMGIYRGLHFSKMGWCVHAPRDPSPQWLGENFRKALMTSEYPDTPELPVADREKLHAYEAAARERRLSFMNDIMQTYGYKNLEQIEQRCDFVYGAWRDLVDDFILFKSCKRAPGGHYMMNTKEFEHARVKVPLFASDETLGLTIRDALARCLTPKRQKINAPAEWRTLPD